MTDSGQLYLIELLLSIAGFLILFLLGIIGFWIQKWIRATDALTEAIQKLEVHFVGKPITINNYLACGNYQYSAFRDSAYTIGATNSQHRHGRAIDFRIQGMSPMEIRADIIKNFELYRASGLTSIEGGTPSDRLR